MIIHFVSHNVCQSVDLNFYSILLTIEHLILSSVHEVTLVVAVVLILNKIMHFCAINNFKVVQGNHALSRHLSINQIYLIWHLISVLYGRIRGIVIQYPALQRARSKFSRALYVVKTLIALTSRSIYGSGPTKLSPKASPKTKLISRIFTLIPH